MCLCLSEISLCLSVCVCVCNNLSAGTLTQWLIVSMGYSAGPRESGDSVVSVTCVTRELVSGENACVGLSCSQTTLPEICVTGILHMSQHDSSRSFDCECPCCQAA